jgi:hypothetical protein
VNQAKSEKKRVPLRPGWFKVPQQPDAKPYLVASRCRKCGKYFFPTRFICLNCGQQTLEEVPLKGKGKVSTYTIVHQQLPGALVTPPYAIANILMEEGCQVQTVMTEGWDHLDVDMGVDVYFEKIREDAEGNELIVYKFRSLKR